MRFRPGKVVLALVLVALVGSVAAAYMGPHPPAVGITAPPLPLGTRFPVAPPQGTEPVLMYPPMGPSDSAGIQETVLFSGIEWSVKYAPYRVGPQYNHFSQRGDSVWVDEAGRLHLAIRERDGTWYAAEVISHETFGYGSYVFFLDTPLDDIDPHVVLGLFTYGADTAHYNEIDIEVLVRNARPVVQFVVQPAYHGRIAWRTIGPMPALSTLLFEWTEDAITFHALPGHVSDPAASRFTYASWTYTGDVPVPAGESVHLNYYLYSGRTPEDGQDQEMIVRSFVFIPP